MNNHKRNKFSGRGPNALWVFLLIFLAAIGFLYYYNATSRNRDIISYSNLWEHIAQKNVRVIEIDGQSVRGEFISPRESTTPDGKKRKTTIFETTIVAPTDAFMDHLRSHDVQYYVVAHDRNPWGFSFLLLPLLLVFLFVFFMMFRQGQGGGSKIFNVGKSRAKFFSPNTIKIKFKDVAGVHEAKEDLRDIVDFLKSPEKFRRLGAKIPRGVLLTGAPGNGKTMLAKAVAGEANCPFFSISGSDFVEVFVGVGASRVRDLFLQARRHAPCIVFIDEIDAVGRQRGAGVGGGNDEREQTLNQLLSEMDGFGTDQRDVIILAATNRPDVLDKALLRPGRFDRKVAVPYPDMVSRHQILSIHSKKVTLSDQVDLEKIARGTSRFSGADLANLINEAALLASKQNKDAIEPEDFEHARDKILVGATNKTLIRTKEELWRTAYHEAGHALVALMLPDSLPLHKVTILSRGGALGITWYLPENDETSKSELNLRASIASALGGRIAEEIIYGVMTRTSGASSDFSKATNIARNMVRFFGMSDLGPVVLEECQSGREYSEETASKVDAEVSRIIKECYDQATEILTREKSRLEKLASALIEKETIDAKQVCVLLDLPPKESKSFIPSEKEEPENEAKA